MDNKCYRPNPILIVVTTIFFPPLKKSTSEAAESGNMCKYMHVQIRQKHFMHHTSLDEKNIIVPLWFLHIITLSYHPKAEAPQHTLLREDLYIVFRVASLTKI